MKALPGSTHGRKVRCGKADCRCARGEPHSAFYRFRHEEGKLRKAYVRRSEAGEVRAACERWQECEAVKRATLSSPAAAGVRAEMRGALREALGEQTHTPAGQRQFRRLRPRRRRKA